MKRTTEAIWRKEENQVMIQFFYIKDRIEIQIIMRYELYPQRMKKSLELDNIVGLLPFLLTTSILMVRKS